MFFFYHERSRNFEIFIKKDKFVAQRDHKIKLFLGRFLCFTFYAEIHLL